MGTKIEKKVESISYFRKNSYLCAVQTIENDDEAIANYPLGTLSYGPLRPASGLGKALQAD